LRWFGKQPIWSFEMIKQLGVPPQTFPVLMYAGMYCQKSRVTTWIQRLSDSEKWKISVLLCTFWAHSEWVVLALRLSSSLDDKMHCLVCSTADRNKWLPSHGATRFSLLQALEASVFFSSVAADSSLPVLAGSLWSEEGRAPLTKVVTDSAVLSNCSPTDVMKDLVSSVVLSTCSPADLDTSLGAESLLFSLLLCLWWMFARRLNFRLLTPRDWEAWNCHAVHVTSQSAYYTARRWSKRTTQSIMYVSLTVNRF